MNDQVLCIENITKCYHQKTVVDNFSFSVGRGKICGLVGPNGAGKTTIMKMLAGLVLPNSGDMTFFDDNNLDAQRSRMSFMIENPIVEGNMTSRQNLEYLRYLRGIADKQSIDRVLKFVGLENTGSKKVSAFSLGMKQRLSIAMALLSSPEIMVMDEPINGVDPEGIVDIRNILKKLCTEQNVTILISSHILAEMAELCTDFAIINNGRLIEKISSEELTVKCRNRISLRTNNMDKTVVVLEKKLRLKDYKVIQNDEIQIFERLGEIEAISKAITDSGIILTKLNIDSESLEEYYLSKVGDVQ